MQARFVRDAVPLLNQLHGSAWRLTHNHADAEDLVQETALRAYVGFGSFQPDTNLRAWLFRVMTNTWISRYRKVQRGPNEVLGNEITDSQLLAADRLGSGGWRSAEAEVMAALPDAELVHALAALPEKYQTVLYYADLQGFGCKEIAEIMGTPIGTVLSRIHRARRRMQVLLADSAHTRSGKG